jgi:hypothetical protein
VSVTFDLPGVTAEAKPMPAVHVRDAIPKRIGTACEARAANVPGRLVPAPIHPFVHAAHLAFAHHLPLVLSPDDVWLCLAQGFAQHVELHAEELRHRFVQHAGKAELVVIRNDFIKGSADNDWPGVFASFSEQIAEHVGKQRDLVVADFSTTGPTEKAASEVVLMAAMKSYFDFTVVTRCGIPRVTLLGTPEDWQSVRRRAATLGEYGLEAWARAAMPALDELCAAAAGTPDLERWRSFYKFRSMSGGDYVTGWITTLFPYLVEHPHRGPDRVVPNAYLAWTEDGPTTDAFPNGLSIAPFLWKYEGQRFAMELVAGFVAVSQDESTGAVRPAIGWAVRDAAKS